MKKYLSLLSISLILSGCQALLSENSDSPLDNTATPSPAQTQSAVTSDAEFSSDTLISLLTAEIAGQRDRFDIALDNYSVQAQVTGDPGVAERAYRIAEYLGDEQQALVNAQIWADAAPDNLDAQRTAAIHLAHDKQYDAAMHYMEHVLLAKGETRFDLIALSAAQADSSTRNDLLQHFNRLLAAQPHNPQLIFSTAILLYQAQRSADALQLLEKQPRKHASATTLLLHARLLNQLQRGEEALLILRNALKEHANDSRVRMAYARQLIELNRLEEARAEFLELLQQSPSNDHLRFSLALINMDLEAWLEAQVYLEDLLERDNHNDAVQYNLARVYEELGDPEHALITYRAVQSGNYYLAAQQRIVDLLLSQERLNDARTHFDIQRKAHTDLSIQLYLIEVEGLSTHTLKDTAWLRINQALVHYENDPSLLYTRALIAEKRNDLAQLEQDLRFIIENDPDNAMALNALGYTLADRTDRLEEARQLIERAHQLEPDDAAITDSLGWVYYRLGDLDSAETLLREAYAAYPDAEIAAHLGEVLWKQGKRSEARRIWNQALKSQPNDAVLLETLQRLNP